MLQDIRRWKLGKSGSYFLYGGGGFQKWPKQIRRLLWTAPIRNLSHACKPPFYLFISYILNVIAKQKFTLLQHRVLALKPKVSSLTDQHTLISLPKAQARVHPKWLFLIPKARKIRYPSELLHILNWRNVTTSLKIIGAIMWQPWLAYIRSMFSLLGIPFLGTLSEFESHLPGQSK